MTPFPANESHYKGANRPKAEVLNAYGNQEAILGGEIITADELLESSLITSTVVMRDMEVRVAWRVVSRAVCPKSTEVITTIKLGPYRGIKGTFSGSQTLPCVKVSPDHQQFLDEFW